MLTHVAGNSGGNTDDMREALRLAETGRMNPSTMVTHIGGLDAVIDATLNLPKIPGGKKLIYPRIDAADRAGRYGGAGQGRPDGRELAKIVARHNGLWEPGGREVSAGQRKEDRRIIMQSGWTGEQAPLPLPLLECVSKFLNLQFRASLRYFCVTRPT